MSANIGERFGDLQGQTLFCNLYRYYSIITKLLHLASLMLRNLHFMDS